jgi:hypothetical protein
MESLYRRRFDMTRLLRLILAAATAVALVGGFPAASHARGGGEHSSPRSGALHVTKECSQYTGLAGSFCTLTSSDLRAIGAGSTIVYASAAGATSLDSDVVLYAGQHNTAFGHVVLDFTTASGTITFAGGTGELTWFHASATVSFDGTHWHWDGTYSFSPSDDNAEGGD